MNQRYRPENGRDTAQLERDIDRTRTSLGRTVDALEERLSPGQLLDQALGMARRHGGEFAGNLGRSVEHHPVPMLLTAVGLAWMMASSREPRGVARGTSRFDEAADRAAGANEPVRSGVGAGAVSERVSGVSHSVGDAAGHAGERLRTERDRLRQGFSNLMEEQPLLVGAIGVALGAALGAALPRTEAEDRLMGEASDSAAHSVKDKATEAYEEVRQAAADVAAPREEEEAADRS